jgi:endonuclease/exonuclease/phosphatase family metal-dependent hydrolase
MQLMDRLRVSTLNVWALPGFMSAHVTERIPAIVDRVAELSVDVAAFQEVWTPRARRLLVEHGREAGLLPAWSADRSPGGLFVLTSLPVSRTSFTRYALAGLPQRLQHVDYYGRKGFAEVELATSAGPLVLVVTHLHARYSDPNGYDEYLGMRSAQVVQLAAFIAAVEAPCIAVGDFNFREDGPEYSALTSLTGLLDAAATLDQRRPTSVPGNPYHGIGHHAEERIDYVFSGAGVAVRDIQRDFDQPLIFDGAPGAYSDHAGLLADVTVSAAPSETSSPDPTAIGLLATLMEQGRAETRRRKIGQRCWGLALLAAPMLARRRLGSAATRLGVGVGAVVLLFAEWVARNEAAGYGEVETMLRSMAARR